VQGLDIDNDETQKMLDELASDPVIEVVEDEVPEVPEKPTTKVGDLFELGDHRLLCGDSTSADDVARLVSGGKIDLAFCSPPYNVGGNTMGGHLKNSKVHSKYTDIDDNMPVDEYSQFLSTTMSHMLAHCTYAVIDIQMLAANKIVLIEWLHEYRDHICDVAIWNKTFGAPAMGDNVLNSAFEFLWIFASEKKTKSEDQNGCISRQCPKCIHSWKTDVERVFRCTCSDLSAAPSNLGNIDNHKTRRRYGSISSAQAQP
jgi:hypothetical protein